MYKQRLMFWNRIFSNTCSCKGFVTQCCFRNWRSSVFDLLWITWQQWHRHRPSAIWMNQFSRSSYERPPCPELLNIDVPHKQTTPTLVYFVDIFWKYMYTEFCVLILMGKSMDYMLKYVKYRCSLAFRMLKVQYSSFNYDVNSWIFVRVYVLVCKIWLR